MTLPAFFSLPIVQFLLLAALIGLVTSLEAGGFVLLERRWGVIRRSRARALLALDLTLSPGLRAKLEQRAQGGRP